MLNFITIPIMLFLLCILLGISTKRLFHFRKEKNVMIVGFVAFFASFYTFYSLYNYGSLSNRLCCFFSACRY